MSTALAMAPPRRPPPLVVAVILAAGLFHALTIRAGHIWGGDYALYLGHTRNLLAGRSYGDTGYIYNPDSPIEAPASYPPVFPLLLAPIYAWRGMDLGAMKLEVVLFFVLALFAIDRVLHDDLGERQRAALLFIVGFLPYFSKVKDSVLSDLPFLFFTYLALWRIERTCSPRRATPAGIAEAVALGACLYLAIGTRTVGVTLVLALVGWELLQRRRPSRVTMVAVAVTLALLALQTVFAPGQGSYADQLHFDRATLIASARYYLGFLVPFRDHGYPLIALLAVVPVLTALALHGWLARAWRGVGVREVFFVVYLAVIYLWPPQAGLRYLVPVFPLYLFYSLCGLHALASRLGPRFAPLVTAAIVAGVGFAYAWRYAGMDHGPIRDGVDKPEAQALFAFLRRATPPGAVLLANKPAIIALYTGRRASIYHRPQDDRDLWQYMDRIGARYVLLGPLDDEYLRGFIGRNRSRLGEIYANSDFRLYHVE